ncbi:MAG: HupE/UreJ family protein [Cyanobacteria bacterium J06649_4]
MRNRRLTRRPLSRLIVSRPIATSVMASVAAVTLATPAFAHHPFGGEAPKSIVEGVLSGIGHPVVGLDHLAFVVAVGLLAAVVRRGASVPAAFVLATVAGTVVHLAGVDLPAAELVISASVVIFGALAVMRDRLNPIVVVLLSAIAGIFHGYAYGEAVVGAEVTPLLAYLIGFAGVQCAIAYGAYLLSQQALNKNQTSGLISVRHAGFMVLGAGAAFLGGLLV